MIVSFLRQLYSCALMNNRYKDIKKIIASSSVVNYGELNDDKKIYIIKRDAKVGLCSYIIMVVGHMYTAKKCGFMPIVDMKNYSNTYLEDELIGKENAWEYYFEQPSNIELEQAYKSRHVVISKDEYCIKRPSDYMSFLQNENGELDFWRKFYRANVKLTKETEEYILSEYSRIISKNDKVLGVLCRGTDYVNKKPKDHPIQPKPQDVILKAKEVMKNKKCNKLFLATEDDVIMDMFVKEFGDAVVTNKHKMWKHNTNEYLSDEMNDHVENKRIIGLNYLTTIAILSRCDCLIGGETSGIVVAMLMSDGYEYSYFWNLGRY